MSFLVFFFDSSPSSSPDVLLMMSPSNSREVGASGTCRCGLPRSHRGGGWGWGVFYFPLHSHGLTTFNLFTIHVNWNCYIYVGIGG